MDSFTNVDVETPAPSPVTERPDTVLPEIQNSTRNVSFTKKLLSFFGFGRNALPGRKSLVSMIWNVSWGFVQSIAVIVMLFLVTFELKSPHNPSVSQWDACDRPLGAWAALWLVRVVLASALAFWEYKRNLQLNRSDLENANNPTPQAPVAGTDHPQSHQGEPVAGTAIDPQSLPHTLLYSRLTIFSSLITLIWFITGNILVYTSINTCRHASPGLWWLNFAILCVLYLMVLEVVVLGFVVLIVAPILFIFWNIFLICIGRHPMQHPNMIKPEIGKLPKTIVDRIPLVIYIPPPDGLTKEISTFPHFYPPKPAKRRLRFKLLKSFAFLSSKPTNTDKKADIESENIADSWVDSWEQGQHPFVTLDGHRAACAICLNDFEAPPKRKVNKDIEEGSSAKQQDNEKASTPVEASTPVSAAVNLETIDESPGGQLRLEDAGAGPQPLRLLGCNHAFHQTCIDPWLIDVSGRCPVCQRPVEPSNPHKSRRN